MEKDNLCLHTLMRASEKYPENKLLSSIAISGIANDLLSLQKIDTSIRDYEDRNYLKDFKHEGFVRIREGLHRGIDQNHYDQFTLFGINSPNIEKIKKILGEPEFKA